MQHKTVGELVLGVELRMSQVPGTSVQIYAEDTIVKLIQNGFDVFFSETFWPHLCVWEQNVPDGTTGALTSDFVSIKSFYDIKAVYIGTTDRQLKALPGNFNPFRLTGTIPVYMQAIAESEDDNRLFQVFPVTATSSIYVNGRAHPGTFSTSETVVPFDPLALELYACWKYLADDGSNPGQIDDMQKELGKRMTQLRSAMNNLPIDLNPGARTTFGDGWTEVS